MHHRRRRHNRYLSDLFQPPAQTPAWNSLPQPVARSVVELSICISN